MLAGGGIKGGQAVGKTSADGMTVEERPVTRARLPGHGLPRRWASTPTKQNISNVGRPIRIVDKAAKPIKEVLA